MSWPPPLIRCSWPSTKRTKALLKRLTHDTKTFLCLRLPSTAPSKLVHVVILQGDDGTEALMFIDDGISETKHVEELKATQLGPIR